MLFHSGFLILVSKRLMNIAIANVKTMIIIKINLRFVGSNNFHIKNKVDDVITKIISVHRAINHNQILFLFIIDVPPFFQIFSLGSSWPTMVLAARGL
jgi:hypothetical protein